MTTADFIATLYGLGAIALAAIVAVSLLCCAVLGRAVWRVLTRELEGYDD